MSIKKEDHMFGRRFAYEFEAGEQEPWAWRHRRHHGHRGWRGRRLFGWHMRRNFFGRGGPFGPEGPFGEEDFSGFRGPGKRFFGRGDLKYALLELLQERPMHGYEMMKALQERTNGMYTPSAGSVYPTLQMLEDRGFVTVTEADGKKVYNITEAGRAFLAEGQQDERTGHGWHGRRRPSKAEMADIAAIGHEVRGLQMLLGHVIRSTVFEPSKLKRLREILAQLRADLEELAATPSGPED
jgi:DNA-binding PadR family transcriptional regulator